MIGEGSDLCSWDILVGEVTAPHGIGGEVKVAPTTDFPERFRAGGVLCVEDASRHRRKAIIESARWHGQRVLLKLSDCPDAMAAEKLRKARLFIAEDMLMPLPEGRYYVKHLIGMQVVTVDGEVVGEIEEVLETGSNDVYVTARGLIPATKEIVHGIDVGERRMVIRPLPGLLDE